MPLRGPLGRDRMGFKTKKGVPCYKDGSPLSTSEAQNLKKHTLIAVRVAMILARLHACGIPFGYETPERCENQASMLHHDEYATLLALPGVKHKVGVQCPFGAESSKPTSWVYYKVDLDAMPTVCEHKVKVWFNVNNSTAIASRHKPIVGKAHYVPAEERDGYAHKPTNIKQVMGNFVCDKWKEFMHDGYETPWNSSKAAKYPDLLNKLLADEIIKAVEAKPTPSPVILPRTDDCQEPNFKRADTSRDLSLIHI